MLILGSDHPGGSLPPYLDVLAAALRRAGATVDRHGSTAIPYHPGRAAFWLLDQAVERARELLDQVDLANYDVL